MMREMVQGPRQAIMCLERRPIFLFHLHMRGRNVNLHFILQLERRRDAIEVEAVCGGLLRVEEVGPG